MTTSREEVGRILGTLDDPATRDLYFCALLSRESGESDKSLIVVGGSAIEIHTRGVYVSGDIDIVGDRDRIAKVLKAWGFAHEQREWYSKELNIVVDLVSDLGGLTGSRSRVRTLVTPYGPIRLAAVEDLIVMRLVSAKYWRIPTDREHAAILARQYARDLDRPYLNEAANRAEVRDEWSALERVLYPDNRRATRRASPSRTRSK
jgi:hypothetical protein